MNPLKRYKVVVSPKGFAYFPLKHLYRQIPKVGYHSTFMDITEAAREVGMIPVVTLMEPKDAMDVFDGKAHLKLSKPKFGSL